MKELKPFVKAIKGVQIVVVENGYDVPVDIVKKSLKNLERSDIVENLVKVNSDGTKINIMIAEKKGKLRNLIMLFNDEDGELMMFNLKMKLKAEKLNDLIKMFNKKDAPQKIKDNIYA